MPHVPHFRARNRAAADRLISPVSPLESAPLFSVFEKLLDPYPNERVTAPPQGFFPFVWACSAGVRRFVLGMTLLTAAIGAFEALLFAMLGHVVDWLARVPPAQLWAKEGGTLTLLAVILALSPVLVVLQAALKYQTLFGNSLVICADTNHRGQNVIGCATHTIKPSPQNTYQFLLYSSPQFYLCEHR